MEKLELKHLAPYLPYGLNILIKRLKYPVSEYVEKLSISNLGVIENKIYNVKPILRPLSDLTKIIEHNGDKFVPIKKIIEIVLGKKLIQKMTFVNMTERHNYFVCCYKNQHGYFYHLSIFEHTFLKVFVIQIEVSNNISKRKSEVWGVPYSVFEYLLEWHFDIFGLIKKGLAVDIDTFKP
jgi:hypothetical protein